MACLLARTPVKAIAIGGIGIRRKLTAKPLNGPRPRCATNIACMLAGVIQRFRWIALVMKLNTPSRLTPAFGLPSALSLKIYGRW